MKRLAIVCVSLGLALSACSDPTQNNSDGSGSIIVGSAAFPESEIIGEIYAQALENAGINVERRMNIGAREAYIPALENGEIDLIGEYTGNLLGFFDPEAKAVTPQEVRVAVEEVLPETLMVLDAAAAQNQDSLNVTEEFSQENNVVEIGDLAGIEGLKLAANPEFADRSYGIKGLERVYGVTGITFVPISDGGGPATVKALLDGDVQVADIYSTTPAIVENNLVTLEDPQNLFTAQNVVPLLNAEKFTDEIADVLNAVSAVLTTQHLLELNAKNQGKDKVSPAQLAKEWLSNNGLV